MAQQQNEQQTGEQEIVTPLREQRLEVTDASGAVVAVRGKSPGADEPSGE